MFNKLNRNLFPSGQLRPPSPTRTFTDPLQTSDVDSDQEDYVRDTPRRSLWLRGVNTNWATYERKDSLVKKAKQPRTAGTSSAYSDVVKLEKTDLNLSRTTSCIKPRCDKCTKVFLNVTAYKGHIERKRSCVKPLETCEKCAKVFDNHKSYRVHMSRTKPCVKTFSTRAAARSHIQRSYREKEKLCQTTGNL